MGRDSVPTDSGASDSGPRDSGASDSGPSDSGPAAASLVRSRAFRFGLAGVLLLTVIAAPGLTAGRGPGADVSSAGAEARAAGGPDCRGRTAPPRDPYPGTTVAATNFESGTLAGLAAEESGTGRAEVSAALARSGTCAARLRVTTDPGSGARLWAGLPGGTTEVFADAWFNIASEGVEGNNVPYFRFFSGGVRVMDVLRQNVSHDLVLRTATPSGFAYTMLMPAVPNDSWHRLAVHFVPNGSATGVQVWWDGQSVFAGTAVNVRAGSVDAVQLGSEHEQQAAEIFIDDVIINSRAGESAAIPGEYPAASPHVTVGLRAVR